MTGCGVLNSREASAEILSIGQAVRRYAHGRGNEWRARFIAFWQCDMQHGSSAAAIRCAPE